MSNIDAQSEEESLNAETQGEKNTLILEKEGIKYIGVVTYETSYDEKDAFGEIINTVTCEKKIFGFESDKYYSYSNVVIELSNLETGEKEVFTFDGFGKIITEEGFDISNYECTQIKGRVYLVDLPEEVILSPFDEYKYGFMICGVNEITMVDETVYDIYVDNVYHINEVKQINQWENIDWENWYMNK